LGVQDGEEGVVVDFNVLLANSGTSRVGTSAARNAARINTFCASISFVVIISLEDHRAIGVDSTSGECKHAQKRSCPHITKQGSRKCSKRQQQQQQWAARTSSQPPIYF
jgi:hypothetical protein